ncbi:ArnT family glycosyltransferase [Singulisphaera sp. PoT]|uniref:ArnT family glycosyltransferase n=1 Tax=Singulisphaera sp. PoT TaxID=3411797 RepID=UPI003BF49BD1
MLGTLEAWIRRSGMEALLAVLATAVFLGFLGSVDLWGKREQRASAEAMDTVDNHHWLVAQIQGRPRLEKPPLPRWTIATLVTLTGRRDEWIVRLPSALAAIGMVGLVYAFGRRMGGRSVGMASGLVLTSMGFFISELRQAGNDGPLAFFTTLALYAAWRRLEENRVDAEEGAGQAQENAEGGRGWNLLFYLALGLGFLTKGPIVLLLVAVTLLPYLYNARQLRRGLLRLVDARGMLLFVGLALSWPLPVLLNDPNAAHVWYVEMGQKAGMAGISHSRHHQVLAADWPTMTAPWILLAISSVFLPFFPAAKRYRPMIWFPWFWAIGNLAMFCLWPVAKPNYYLPCLPGMALMIGIEWIRLTQKAREIGPRTNLARRTLQFHWIVPFVVGAVAPVVVGQIAPAYLAWVLAFSLIVLAAVVASAWAWRRGADVGALAPLVTAWALGIMILYGAIAPKLNATHSHRQLATKLESILPADTRTVMFFQELDEGLWFYLKDRALLPIPGSQPQYNKGYDLYKEYRIDQLELDTKQRVESFRKVFVKWAEDPKRETSYVLMKRSLYNALAPALAGVVRPLHSEENLDRHELVLLGVADGQELANRSGAKQRQ